MFTDEAKISVRAGKGGLGGKHFLREKYKPLCGPAGGDGGAGGSIYLKATPNLNSLFEFQHHRIFVAPDGDNGMRNKMAGRDAEDITISVPCGTLVRNADTKEIIVDLVEADKPFLLAKGGKGGLGNYHFVTSRNQAPTYSQPGLPGEFFNIEMELKLIADIGFVGMPNAGKSTLLNALTKAHSKVGAYPFTTLHPSLGILTFYEKTFVLADIPGLIEGASEGVGLGDEFLRHIERTKYIIHLIDVSGFGGDPFVNYNIINKELKAYSENLANKKQIIVLNKTDVTESAEYIKQFKQKVKNQNILCISAATNQGTEEVKKAIFEIMTTEPKPEKVITKAKAKVKTKAKVKSKIKVKTKVKPKVKSKPKLKAKAKPKLKPKAKVKSKKKSK